MYIKTNNIEVKIAIVHEMLIKLGGAEKVVERLLHIFPNADLYTLIYNKSKVSKVFGKYLGAPGGYKIKTPFITTLIYKIFKNQRFCLPFMSKAIESFNLNKYDIVISSSSGFAHGIITNKNTKLIIYSHSPARYMWDRTNEYKKDIGWNKGIKGFILNKLFLKLRIWDFLASKKSDIILANSKNTQKRIKKYYKRYSKIIYPPVETKRFEKKIDEKIFIKISKNYKIFKKDYYIIISALTEFKKIDIAIKAFNKIDKINLVIIGEGKYKKTLENLVKNKNIKFIGAQYSKNLVSLVQNSKGLIFPGEEDFGIVPIEVMAAGLPIFAYKGGGLLESIDIGKTGEFFKDKTGKDFIENFLKFDKNNKSGKYKEEYCKKQASKFSLKNFDKSIKKIINSF